MQSLPLILAVILTFNIFSPLPKQKRWPQLLISHAYSQIHIQIYIYIFFSHKYLFYPLITVCWRLKKNPVWVVVAVLKIHMFICAQSCPTLCNPMNRSPSGSSAPHFPGKKYPSGLPCPPPGDLPNPGI